MVQPHKKFSLRLLRAEIVRAGLFAAVFRQVDKPDARIRQRGDHRRRVIRAGITHHEQFPVRHRLPQHHAQREGEDVERL